MLSVPWIHQYVTWTLRLCEERHQEEDQVPILINKNQDYKYPHFKLCILSSKDKGKIFWAEFLCYEMLHKSSTIHTTIETLQKDMFVYDTQTNWIWSFIQTTFYLLRCNVSNILNIMRYTLRELAARRLPRRLNRVARPNAMPTAYN
jgi:hypothetical protein